MPDFQERLKFAAQAMLYSTDLATFEGFSEMRSRDVLCAEILECLAAYTRASLCRLSGVETTPGREQRSSMPLTWKTPRSARMDPDQDPRLDVRIRASLRLEYLCITALD